MPSLVQDKETNKKLIGEYLKAADKFIKSGEFPKALDEVGKALGIEPNNMYALAYNERIKVALEAARKKEEEEHIKKLSEEQKKAAVEQKTAAKPAASPPTVPPRAQQAPDAKPQPVPAPPPSSPTASTATIPGDEMITRIKKEAQEAAEKTAAGRIETLKQEFSTVQAKLQQDVAQARSAKEALEKSLSELASKHKNEVEQLKAQHQEELSGVKGQTGSVQPPKEQGAAFLRSLFQKAWDDGTISSDERTLLTTLKTITGVPDDEFTRIENESKGGSYLAALREVWKDGSATPEEMEMLDNIRKTLSISAEEHLRLERQVRKEFKR